MKYFPFIFIFYCFNSFADTMTFKCSYSEYSDRKGSHVENPPLAFDILLDSENGKAYILGSEANIEVIPFVQKGQISFLEVTGTGNIMTTTIVDDMSSVHSRNSALFGKLIPSQYYGKCTLK